VTWSIAACCSIFYNFDGVRHFKAKFAPTWWESEYVLMSPDIAAPPRILSAVIHAVVPAGPSHLIVRQMSRAWRRLKTKKQSPIALTNRVSVIECKGKNET
jgi:hypothetical protein